MKFSVVMPLYNKRQYVARAVKSVLAQTFTDYELIVVDDGSTDDSSAIVKGFDDERIHLFQKANSGVSDARNYGINKAQGTYVAFLDADDEWHPDFLAAINELSKKYPEAGICATAILFVKQGKAYPTTIKHLPPLSLLSDYCAEATHHLIVPFITSSSSVRRDCFEKAGLFRSGVRAGEDLDMWLRLACHYPVAFHNKPLATYYFDAPDPTRLGRTFGKTMELSLWYDYDYSPKQSLTQYVDKNIYNWAYAYLKARRWSVFWEILKKCRGSRLRHLVAFMLYAFKRTIRGFIRRAILVVKR